jgi:hypothetical protein
MRAGGARLTLRNSIRREVAAGYRHGHLLTWTTYMDHAHGRIVSSWSRLRLATGRSKRAGRRTGPGPVFRVFRGLLRIFWEALSRWNFGQNRLILLENPAFPPSERRTPDRGSIPPASTSSLFSGIARARSRGPVFPPDAASHRRSGRAAISGPRRSFQMYLARMVSPDGTANLVKQRG